MGGVIFDSCIWVGLASGQINPQHVVKACGKRPVFTSSISLGELVFGVESCVDPMERAMRASALQQVTAYPVLDVTAATAKSFGVLAAAVKSMGRSPRPRFNDLWIAAQAVEQNHTLLTLNVSDFAGLPGLRVEELTGRI